VVPRGRKRPLAHRDADQKKKDGIEAFDGPK